MSNIIHTVKDKLSGSSSSSSSNNNSNSTERPSGKADKEPTYNILPHPAKTNDPADLQRNTGDGSGGGLRHNGPMDAFHARDPYVPSEEVKRGMPAPLSREELHARQAQLRSATENGE